MFVSLYIIEILDFNTVIKRQLIQKCFILYLILKQYFISYQIYGIYTNAFRLPIVFRSDEFSQKSKIKV